MASVSHQALLMVSTGSVGIDGWLFPLSVVRDTPRRPVSTFNSDGAWLAALAFAATGVRGVQWQQPLSVPKYPSHAIPPFNADGAWIVPISPAAVAGGVSWQQSLSVRPRSIERWAPSILDPSSYAQAWLSVAARDPSWASVVLLLGFEGTNGSQGAPGYTDESPVAHGTAAVSAGASISTAQSKFGASSGRWLSSGSGCRFSPSVSWALGSGSFTIETSIRVNSLPSSSAMLMGMIEAGQFSWYFWIDSTGHLNWTMSTTGANLLNDISYAWSPTLATWYFITVDFDGTKYRMYVNGVMVASSTTLRTIFDTGDYLGLGCNSIATGLYFDGWMDELRITKGVARYASDGGFTPPTAAFPRS